MHKGVVLDDKAVDFIGSMMPVLNEKQRRLFLAKISDYYGYGSAKELSQLTGVSQKTISKAKVEFKDAVVDPRARPHSDELGGIRAPGAGRKSILESNPEIWLALEELLDGNTVGNPQSPIKWTTKSLRNLENDLLTKGIPTSHVTIGKILESKGYSLQQNKKYTESGNPGPDRDAQFQFISRTCQDAIECGLPVISIDAKKKENLGDFQNKGKEYRLKGEPRLVRDHDFVTDEGHAIPYGIFDIGRNEGFVNVGVSADTGQFAVESISTWWFVTGRNLYPDAKDIYITADGGGSNGSRLRLWKYELQNLADYTGLNFHVMHFPPGTSKWNKIEHRMFSFISLSWRGIPLEDLNIVVNLIGSTTNLSGLKIKCVYDTFEYEKGRLITEEEYASINIERDTWRGDWNYVIRPRD